VEGYNQYIAVMIHRHLKVIKSLLKAH